MITWSCHACGQTDFLSRESWLEHEATAHPELVAGKVARRQALDGGANEDDAEYMYEAAVAEYLSRKEQR